MLRQPPYADRNSVSLARHVEEHKSRSGRLRNLEARMDTRTGFLQRYNTRILHIS
jgi:hypothetical protein